MSRVTGTPQQVPAWRYTSEDFAALEREFVWARVWQMACREDEVAARGDFAEYAAGDQSVLVVRGGDGVLRAFHNVCQHRGNRLRDGTGNTGRAIRCRYHCWTYHLDGTVKDIPDRAGFGDLCEADYGLREVRLDTWAGFVFVCVDPEAPPLDEFLEPLAADLEPYHLGRMTRTVDITTPVSANWKVVVEAFLEVYHVQGIHPQLLPMLDDVNTTYAELGIHSRMVVPFGVPSPRIDPPGASGIYRAMLRAAAGARDGGDLVDGQPSEPPQLPDESASIEFPPDLSARDFFVQMVRTMSEGRGVDISGLAEGQLIDDWHYHIFPNLVFNTHAGGFLFFRIRPGPTPDSALFDFMIFETIGDEAEARERRAPHLEYAERTHSLGEVLDQDLENLPGVQRGLHSRGIEHVTLSDQEQRIVHFHRVLERYLASSSDPLSSVAKASVAAR